jgi:ABC-2 type transport system ATP-binding protein
VASKGYLSHYAKASHRLRGMDLVDVIPAGRPRLLCVTEAVSVRHLAKQFGATTALADMTWAARPGQVTAVLGPNGAGKTTTIECAEGLQRPDSGQVRVLGTDPWQAGPDHRAAVGVMLQDGGLPNASTPVRLLRHLAAFHSSPADVDALVDRLGIAAFAGTTVRRLSGGQKQRVALAAALIGRPQVAFLDEPTAGLDPHARLDAWDLLRETRDSGCAVIVTTHSFEEAQRLADHIVIVHKGSVAAQGSMSELTGDGSLEDVYFSLTRESAP